MGNILMKMDILFSLALNYPVIKYQGYLMKPIACVVPSIEEAEKIINHLSTFSKPKILSTDSKPKISEKMLADANSEFVFIYYTNSPQSKKILQIAITAALTGKVDERDFNAIPLIFFQLTIPENWRNYCFLWYIAEDIPFKDISVNKADKLINEFWNQHQIVRRFIQKIEERNSMKGALMCAAYFLFPKMSQLQEDPEDLLEEYLKVCKELIDMDENAREESGVAEVFISLLHDWIGNNSGVRIYPTSEVYEQDVDGSIFCDKEFLYIPEVIFEKITEPMRNIQIGAVIKKILNKEGLLVCDQSTAYTSKVVIWNVYGVMKRIRALKFRLDKINQTGDIPLLQLSGIEGDENDTARKS
ncbi:MAG: hypothetical protein QM657_07155 [Lacrimispora sp.]|uniref:hypothetical protein n=1 Tax=Lacrimispora sp. TaxID=2719234 RepID=UPI0039E361BA